MARGKSSRNRLRLAAAVLLLALLGGAYGWWHMHHWLPSRSAFPVQGVEVGAEDGDIDWKAVKAIGADFAYVDASASAFARDPRFSRNLDDARAARLQIGAVHRYDPCQPAERQAANFVTVVPRDAALLPPAVELDRDAGDCPVKVSDAKLESELGWTPRETFDSGLEDTVRWYLAHRDWVEAVRTGEYTRWIEAHYGKRA